MIFQLKPNGRKTHAAFAQEVGAGNNRWHPEQNLSPVEFREESVGVWYEGEHIYYATSEDGQHFEKPNLGLFEWEGSKNNNIAFDPSASPGPRTISFATNPIRTWNDATKRC